MRSIKKCHVFYRVYCSRANAANISGLGRAPPLCPCRSDVDLFRDSDGVIDLDSKVAHCALDL